MTRRTPALALFALVAACSEMPTAPDSPAGPGIAPVMSVASSSSSGDIVIDDFNGPNGSWSQHFPSLYVRQVDASVLGGARELRSYRDARTRIDATAGTLEWGGRGVSPEYGLSYGSLIGSNFHYTKGSNPNSGLGTPLNLNLSLEGELVFHLRNVSATNPYFIVILHSSSGGLYWFNVAASPGEVRVPLSNFYVYHGSAPIPAAAAADIDGIFLDGFAHLDTGTPGTGTVFERISVSAGAVDDSPPVITPSVSGTTGDNGWYTSDVSVSWTVTDADSDIDSSSGCNDATVDTDTNGVTFTCTAISAGGTATGSVTISRDATTPAVAYAGNAGTYTVDQTVAISCSASDATSGLASSSCPEASGAAYSFGLGSHTLSAAATDLAGNTASASSTFSVQVTSESLCSLVQGWVTQKGVANALCQQLRNGTVNGFQNLVRAQTGKHVPAAHASRLIALSEGL